MKKITLYRQQLIRYVIINSIVKSLLNYALVMWCGFYTHTHNYIIWKVAFEQNKTKIFAYFDVFFSGECTANYSYTGTLRKYKENRSFDGTRCYYFIFILFLNYLCELWNLLILLNNCNILLSCMTVCVCILCCCMQELFYLFNLWFLSVCCDRKPRALSNTRIAHAHKDAMLRCAVLV